MSATHIPAAQAVSVELTPAELKLTHTALRALLSDLRHDDREIRDVVRGVLAKLPPQEAIDEIDLRGELARLRGR
jgi:hypothetical protein